MPRAKGDGKGPAANFMAPPPADFTDKDDACCGGDTGPGDFYYRILRGWPGTAMENFGERLSVDDIWRVVLFVKTIPNHTLEQNRIPEPSDYITWQPSKELLGVGEVAARSSRTTPRSQEAAAVAVHAGGDARVPGPRTRPTVVVTGLATPLTLRKPPPASRRSTAASSTGPGPTPSAAAASCRPISQKAIPPEVQGQQ